MTKKSRIIRKFRKYQDYCDYMFKQCETTDELTIMRNKLLDKGADGMYGFTNETIDRVFPPLNKKIARLFNNILARMRGEKCA